MPGKTLQIFVKGFEGKTHTIQIDEDASIAQLLQKVKDITHVDSDEGDMRVLYGTKDLRSHAPNGKALTLKDFNIGDLANMCVVLRLRGGSNDNNTEQPKILDNDVELSDLPDMITLDDDKDGQRAKMPCGHAIGPESLTAYCRSLLTAGKFEFRCPYTPPMCNALWEFFTVKRLAVLTPDEIKEFETKVCENYLRKAVGIQECPSCESYCERKNKKDRRVVCPACTRKRGKSYDFCWYCLKTWLGSGTDDCGNLSCAGVDPRLRIIMNCQKKTVVGVLNCPAVRACPTCGLLIEHKEACKHMNCPCGQKFCFICLKTTDSSGNYQCGSYNTKCEVAAIQTTIPGV